MNFLTFDLNLLRIFDMVMTERNLTRAADRLATTQPAVSNALRRLREIVDDDLVVRSARGVRPTARAEQLWPAVRQALHGIETAMAPPSWSLAASRAVLRLAMADATAVHLLPPLMDAIKREAPLVDVRVLPLVSRDPRQALEQGEADLAVGSFPGVAAQLAGSQTGDHGFSHASLYRSDYVCAMRRGHPLAEARFDIDAYCEAHHALVSFSGKAHGPADEALERIGRRRRVALTVNQFSTLFRVVLQSDLVTIVPRHLVEAYGVASQVVLRPVPFVLEDVRVDMLWHERHEADRTHRWLRETLARSPLPPHG